MGKMIEARDLSKTYKVKIKSDSFLKDMFNPNYKKVQALKSVSFDINEGEAIGYIGLNGAGKSTTIKLLTGILTPTTGDIKLFNSSIREDKLKKNKQIGVIFGNKSNLIYDLPVEDSYIFLKKLYEVDDESYDKTINMLDEILGIKKFFKTAVRKLSFGQRMKCELGAILIHNPKIIFLDEPTIGLDIFARDELIECIQYVKEKFDATIFLTTHNMIEVEKICDRLFILDKGEIIFDGTLQDLRTKVGNMQNINLILANETVLSEECKYFEHIVEQSENSIKLAIDKDKNNISEVMRYFYNTYEIIDSEIQNASLEDMIKCLYEKGDV